MKILIETLYETQEGKIIVTGRNPIGLIKGTWKSINIPLVNEEYDVELTLPILSGDAVMIEESHLPAQSLVDSNDRLYLRGKCEVIDEDNIYVIRFNTNWIEMLEIEANKIDVNDIISFTVPVNQVEINPISW